MRTSAAQAFTPIQHVAQAYTERVRQLPYVQQVLLVRTDKRHTLYTVIDAPFTNFKQAYPLHRAEHDARGNRDLLPVAFVTVTPTAEALQGLRVRTEGVPPRWRHGVQVLYDRDRHTADTDLRIAQ